MSMLCLCSLTNKVFVKWNFSNPVGEKYYLLIALICIYLKTIFLNQQMFSKLI